MSKDALSYRRSKRREKGKTDGSVETNMELAGGELAGDTPAGIETAESSAVRQKTANRSKRKQPVAEDNDAEFTLRSSITLRSQLVRVSKQPKRQPSRVSLGDTQLDGTSDARPFPSGLQTLEDFRSLMRGERCLSDSLVKNLLPLLPGAVGPRYRSLSPIKALPRQQASQVPTFTPYRVSFALPRGVTMPSPHIMSQGAEEEKNTNKSVVDELDKREWDDQDWEWLTRDE